MPNYNDFFPLTGSHSILRALERNAKLRYVPITLDYHISQGGLTPLYNPPTSLLIPSSYSFRGTIYVQERCLKISTQASASISWRPGGASVTLSLEATLSRDERVIDRKIFNFFRLSIHNPTDYGLTRVEWVEFELPEPTTALRLNLEGKCVLNENHGSIDVSWGVASATGSFNILLE